MPIKSRTKGKVGELELAAKLSEAGFPATRGQQHSGSPDSPDVICDGLTAKIAHGLGICA